MSRNVKKFISCAIAAAAIHSGPVSKSNAGDFRVTIGVRTNSADDLSWLRRHESYADRYSRYSGARYSYPRYGYGSRYYGSRTGIFGSPFSSRYFGSRYYGSSAYRFSPSRYYYRPSYTLPYDPYGSRSGYSAYSSPRVYVGSPYAFSFSTDGYYFGRAGTGLGYGSSNRQYRRLVPPSDCCARPYYCYYMGIMPAVPSRIIPAAPLNILPPTQPEPVPMKVPFDTQPIPESLPPQQETPQPKLETPLEQPKLTIPDEDSSTDA